MSKGTDLKKKVSRPTALVFIGLAVVSLMVGVLLMLFLPVPPNAQTQHRAKTAQIMNMSTTPLNVQTQDGQKIEFDVFVADTADEREMGLMYVQSLPQDQGMIFDFQTPQRVAFWMKNTLISLDILYIGADGRIRQIFDNAKAGSEEVMFSDGKMRAVLEINAGLSKKLGIQPGDLVKHSLFK